MSGVAVFMDAWRNRKSMGDTSMTRDIAAFLPAALEVQETPPNPIAKWLGRSLILLFTLAVVWACFGEVDVVASAEGKIIPSSRIKQIQPMEKAIVKKILVHDGQYVAQGQALIEMDATITQADQTRIEGELNNARLQLTINQNLLKLLNLPLEEQSDLSFEQLQNKFPKPLGANELTAQINASYENLLWQQWQQYWAQRQALQSTLAKTEAEQAANREVIKKLEQTLPIVEKRVQILEDLMDKGFASETEYLQLEQERIQQKQDLAAEKQRYKQSLAAGDEVFQRSKELTAQIKTKLLIEVNDSQRKIHSLVEEQTKATDLNKKQILYSPVSGQVQQLAINTVGGVVTAAQQLMVVVPDSEQLEVEVFLDNKDIGFIQEGMASEIKVHTFPFTKYGIIDGKVTSISNDAIVDEKRGLIYSMRVEMAKNTIDVNGKEVKLMPGMAVTAEMRTDKRKVIEFFMAPLLRHRDEGLRER